MVWLDRQLTAALGTDIQHLPHSDLQGIFLQSKLYFKSKDSELFQTTLHFGSTIGHLGLEILGITCWQADVSQV